MPSPGRTGRETAIDPDCYCAAKGLGYSCLASAGELCEMVDGNLPVAARSAREVAGTPNGEHFGTCSRCDDGHNPCVCGHYKAAEETP